MSCATWQVIRRPEYRDDLDAIEAWVAKDNPIAAVDLWLLIDGQVDHLSAPNFPRRASERVAGAYELVEVLIIHAFLLVTSLPHLTTLMVR